MEAKVAPNFACRTALLGAAVEAGDLYRGAAVLAT